jgi:hypothetical protein
MSIPGGIPTDPIKLLDKANEWVEACRASQGMRAAYYRTMNALAETGRYDGTKSLLNMLHKSLDETAAHLFSPVELKFSMDFEKPYPKQIYQRGAEAAKGVTRIWERNSTDIAFARGVFESLKYGCVLQKQWPEMEGHGEDEHPVYRDALVMPWNFGVYREDKVKIDEQEILCETSNLTGPEIWKRIWKLPKAEQLYTKIMTNARKGQASGEPSSFFHQVLSTSQINTGIQSMISPVPGGIVQMNNDPNYSLMGPVIAVDQVRFHELWVKGDKGDYVTIQLIEPDILVTPYSDGRIIFKQENLLSGKSGAALQPFRKIQPNETEGWFWGRSELVDLIEPQALLSMWCDDLKRMYGMQVDKLIFFAGDNTITDELYGQWRAAGFGNLGPGAQVNDLTPQLPAEALPLLKWIQEQINIIRGFPPIMQGMGEQGVRAGSHANMLMKTASPTLRDRALIVERNCAECADLTASLRELKEERFYWTEGDDIKKIEESSFLLTDLPPDWRITVDSHSSSPIFSDENTQLVFAAQQRGVVDEEYVIDNTPLPNKEIAKISAREAKKQKAETIKQLMQTDPEGARKVLEKSLTGGKHR